MSIQVYNTLTRKKEPFRPRDEGRVSIYVCGITPYDESHLGHAVPTVIWDAIRRFLEYRGYQVRLIQNFTDVDDKIIARARETGQDPLRLSRHYSEEYLQSMDALKVKRADVYPRVSEEIDTIIEMVRTLVDKGHAYVVDGDVYFDVTSFPDYGKLSQQKLDEIEAGTRFEVDERKRNAMDFALWKKAKEGEPAWDSPWGKGRPGWHIECSAMSLKYLGNHFDFHGGGVDLIFPHHENEIAQSEAYTGAAPFVRYWCHNGLLQIKNEKMSKSLGNFTPIREVLKRYPAEAIRFYVLSTHYRSPLEYSEEKLEQARRGWERLHTAVGNLRHRIDSLAAGVRPAEELVRTRPGEEQAADGPNGVEGAAGLKEEWTGTRSRGEQADAPKNSPPVVVDLQQAVSTTRAKFIAAMEDDFNTALAIAALFELVRVVNSFERELVQMSEEERRQSLPVLQEAYSLFMELGKDVLGIIGEETAGDTSRELVEKLLDLLVDVRQAARNRKDWETADKIRDELARLGITLEDSPLGTRWRM